ncbi:MAG: c-type cytochrome, partial [Planctomycetales bacterium]
AANGVDMQPDRFARHALTQCVKALAEYWVPALQADQIQFASSDQLSFVLRAYGGRVQQIVKELLKRESLSESARRPLLELLAEVGDIDDLRLVYQSAVKDTDLLLLLARISAGRGIQKTGKLDPPVQRLFDDPSEKVRMAAIRIAGLWQQTETTGAVEKILKDQGNSNRVRAAAMRSLAELAPASDVQRFRPYIDESQQSEIWLAALQAVGQRNLPMAISDGLNILARTDDSKVFADVLETLMQRKGASVSLVEVLKRSQVSADTAKKMSRWLSAAGHDDADLVDALKKTMGIKPGEAITYDADFVKQLTQDIRTSGDPANGLKVFHSSLTNCTACHRVSEEQQLDFARGPDLTAVASGLPLDIIVESVIWPERQIKEGYELTTLYLDDGRMLSGYITSRATNTVTLRDLASGNQIVIERDSIENFSKKGTAMPAGFTNTLTRTELRDLVAYLATLKGPETEAAK